MDELKILDMKMRREERRLDSILNMCDLLDIKDIEPYVRVIEREHENTIKRIRELQGTLQVET
jgi:hypothetical protein